MCFWAALVTAEPCDTVGAAIYKDKNPHSALDATLRSWLASQQCVASSRDLALLLPTAMSLEPYENELDSDMSLKASDLDEDLVTSARPSSWTLVRQQKPAELTKSSSGSSSTSPSDRQVVVLGKAVPAAESTSCGCPACQSFTL